MSGEIGMGSEDAFQVVLKGHGPFSAPYTSREEAEERAEELELEVSGETSCHVESWPNHRQKEAERDRR